jgi:hydroxyacylglutathione hydrolase
LLYKLEKLCQNFLNNTMNPPSFSGPRAAGWVRGQRIHQYEQGTMQNFVYLIACSESKQIWIVDPHKDWGKCLSDAATEGYSLAGCLLTHSHHDHIAGLPTLLEAHPNLPIIAGKDDAFRLKKFSNLNLRLLEKDEPLQLGSISVEAIHSPGHSAGEFCYFLPHENPPLLLTGDVLFIRQCGRTDLETGSDQALFQTLGRIKNLPHETLILPGHHYSEECSSTLQIELIESPPLLARTWEELRDLP